MALNELPPPPSPRTTEPTRPAVLADRSGPMIAMLLGAVAIVIGSIGTWAKVSAGFLSRSLGGLDTTDGKVTIAIGILILGLAFLQNKRGLAITAVCVTLISGGIGIYNWVDGSNKINKVESSYSSYSLHASLGWGLFAVIIGSVAAFIGAIIWLNTNRAATS